MKLTRHPHRSADVFAKQKPLLLRKFQWRYTSYLLGATLISILIVGGTAFYMSRQNYEMFTTIAVRFAPQLIENLERERNWINSFLLVSTFAIISIYTFIGIRLTSRLIVPILLLQRHLKNLTRGDLSQPQIRIRDNDEFQDLIDTYNYFYSALRLQAQLDLSRLRQIPVDPHNRDAQRTLGDLIQEREARILINPSVSFDSALDSHRAS